VVLLDVAGLRPLDVPVSVPPLCFLEADALTWVRGAGATVLAVALIWLITWAASPYPWAAPREFSLLGITYHVTSTRVRTVGPPLNWDASGRPPAVTRDLWGVSGHRRYNVLAFRTKWGYFLAIAKGEEGK